MKKRYIATSLTAWGKGDTVAEVIAKVHQPALFDNGRDGHAWVLAEYETDAEPNQSDYVYTENYMPKLDPEDAISQNLKLLAVDHEHFDTVVEANGRHIPCIHKYWAKHENKINEENPNRVAERILDKVLVDLDDDEHPEQISERLHEIVESYREIIYRIEQDNLYKGG